MTYDCMTPEEYALWRDGPAPPSVLATTPCVDCPMWFHLAEKAAGRCDREPSQRGIASPDSRARLREAQRRYSARRRCIGPAEPSHL